MPTSGNFGARGCTGSTTRPRICRSICLRCPVSALWPPGRARVDCGRLVLGSRLINPSGPVDTIFSRGSIPISAPRPALVTVCYQGVTEICLLGATIRTLHGVFTGDWDSLGGLRTQSTWKVRVSSRGRPGHRTGSDPAGRPLWARFGHRQRLQGPLTFRGPIAPPQHANVSIAQSIPLNSGKSPT